MTDATLGAAAPRSSLTAADARLKKRHAAERLFKAQGVAAIVIACSRVPLGVHFASDLMPGALAGISGALIVWHIAFQLRRRRHLRLMPHLKRLRSAWTAQG